MNSLHTHSVLSIPYELPVLSRPAAQPYGMLFGECKIEARISLDKTVPFHLLFLLKGAAHVNVGGKEMDIFQNEFLVVDTTLEYECICTQRSYYVMISLEKPLYTGTELATDIDTEQWLSAHPRTIPPGLLALLRYMLPTMPLNEKITHHFIPRIAQAMMRT